MLGLFTVSEPRAAGAAEAYPGVTLTRSDRSGVSFEIDAGDVSLEPAFQAPPFSELRLAHFSAAGEMGTPALPCRIIWIGIPCGATLSLESLSEETRTFHDVHLLPRRATGEDGKPDGPSLTPEVIEALAASPSYRCANQQDPWARVTAVTGLRAQRVCGIEIRPAHYDSQTGELEVATRISVTVRFEGEVTTFPAARPEPGFENLYRSVLLNGEAACPFRGPIGAPAPSRSRLHLEGAGASHPPVGFDVAATWIEVSVERKGIQEVRGSDLQAAGVALDEIDPSKLRLFTRAGVPLLDESSFCDTCGLSEAGIRVEDGEDGHFDTDDRILFFGLAPSGWRDDFTGPGGAPDEWLDHPYERKNVYWLTWDASLPDPPRRWALRDVSPTHADAVQVSSYPARLHWEADAAYEPDSYSPGTFWDQWAWRVLTPNRSPFESTVDCSGAVEAAPARLRAHFWGLQSSAYIIGPDHLLDVSFNGHALPLSWYGALPHDLDTTAVWAVDGADQFSVQARLPQSTYFGPSTSFYWWELRFARRLQAANDTLEFASPDTSATVGYSVAPFSDTSSGFQLLDVSDPLAPAELTGWAASDTSGGRAVHFDDDGGSRFYYASAASRRLHPSLARANPRDPRRGGADYLVICSDDLEAAAVRLAEHRRGAYAPFPGATSAVVRMSDILDWYAGGRMDPVAIRNFLHDIVVNGGWSPAPTMVCLLGDASFDFKNALANVGDSTLAWRQVPTFEHGYYAGHFPCDDWLVDMDAPPPGTLGLPDLIVGRLPAANVSEADQLVDKVISYESQPERGDWRSRILLVADDLYQGTQADPLGGTHTSQADSLARDYLPDWLDPAKVFLLEYGFTSGTDKAGAHDEIRRQLDRGAVFWHYIGHGSPYTLADEHAFTVTDVPSLSNAPRLPVFFAAGCEVGPYDSPFFTSLGEALLKRPGGGVIASFASAVLTYASQNYDLDKALYERLFSPPASGGAQTLGEAAFAAKHRLTVSENDITYGLLGDPGTRIAIPGAGVRIRFRDSETGAALEDSLPCGRRIRLEAEVHGSRDPSAPDLLAAFAGNAVIRVTDAPPLEVYPLYPTIPSSQRSYEANARTAFLGSGSVKNGLLTAEFVVPLEAARGPRARVEVYAANEAVDASGSRFVSLARLDSAMTDTAVAGPHIQVRSASGGEIVGPGESLIVTLDDPSGIFTLADSTALGIQLSLDGGPSTECTDRFAYDVGSCARGSFSYSLPHLADGQHHVTVQASGNLARESAPQLRRSQTDFGFRVVSLVETSAVAAFVLPNPFQGASGTHLVFSGFSQPTVADVLVYDISGALVRRLSGAGTGHVEVDWDGKDRDGRSLRSGIYCYRAVLRPEAGGSRRQLDGRLVLLR